MNDDMEISAGPTAELYLVTPSIHDARAFLPKLMAVFDSTPVAAVRLVLPESALSILQSTVEVLRPSIQDRGVAVILDGQPELARMTGCDGVHVVAEAAAEARKIIGGDLQLGAFCGFSRDLAMRAGEDGADYIAFGPFSAAGESAASEDEDGLDILRWWTSLMELPVVAEVSLSPEDSALERRLTRHADFVAVSSSHTVTNEATGEASDLWNTPAALQKLWAASS